MKSGVNILLNYKRIKKAEIIITIVAIRNGKGTGISLTDAIIDVYPIIAQHFPVVEFNVKFVWHSMHLKLEQVEQLVNVVHVLDRQYGSESVVDDGHELTQE